MHELTTLTAPFADTFCDFRIVNRVDNLVYSLESRHEAAQYVSPEELCAEELELPPEVRGAIHSLEQVESRFGVHRK